MNMPNIYLLDQSASMVAAWLDEFDDEAGVIAVQGDFARFMYEHPGIDCVVSPANSYGLMDGGYDHAITKYFGTELQERVQQAVLEQWLGEQPVGTSMSVDYEGIVLIHTPMMRVPSAIVDPMVVYHAMRSTLIEAMRRGVQTMVIPAFGAGCGTLTFDVVAKMMAEAYFQIANPPKSISWEYADSRQLPDMSR